MEISLPPSGLGKVNYPDIFPSPPTGNPGLIDESGADAAIHQPDSPPSTLTPELENSWGYYLSDIAVRQITNRLINTFYRDSESSWLSVPIDRMIRVAEELELQLTQWSVYYYCFYFLLQYIIILTRLQV